MSDQPAPRCPLCQGSMSPSKVDESSAVGCLGVFLGFLSVFILPWFIGYPAGIALVVTGARAAMHASKNVWKCDSCEAIHDKA